MKENKQKTTKRYYLEVKMYFDFPIELYDSLVENIKQTMINSVKLSESNYENSGKTNLMGYWLDKDDYECRIKEKLDESNRRFFEY